MLARRAADPFDWNLGHQNLHHARPTLAAYPRDQIGVGDDSYDMLLVVYHHHPLVRGRDEQFENFLNRCRFVHARNVARHYVTNRSLNAESARLRRMPLGKMDRCNRVQYVEPGSALVIASASTFAGNLTVVGSLANLIVLEEARKERIEISFTKYLRVGLPLTIMTLAIDVLALSAGL